MERITSLPVIGLNGQVVKQIELPAEVTSFKIKPAVIHQVMVAEAAARRAGTAHTKVRSEVRGGGKKPWKQKGTGRARQGSTRSPQWVGGGVVHGPRKTRVYEQRTPIKLTRQARAGVVADYLTSGRVVVVEALPKELKTKQSAALLAKTKLRPGASLLVMLTTAEVAHRRAMRNLKGVTVAAVGHLGVYDGLQNSRWLVTEAGLGQLMHFVR